MKSTMCNCFRKASLRMQTLVTLYGTFQSISLELDRRIIAADLGQFPCATLSLFQFFVSAHVYIAVCVRYTGLVCRSFSFT